MKERIYRSVPLLLGALFAGMVVTAQPGYHKDGNHYDRNDYGRDERRDHEGGYNNGHRQGHQNNYEQYSVRRRPSAPYCAPAVRPSPAHVWIDPQWMWNRGPYVHQAGYWTLPRQRGVWVPGHWERNHRRWFWVSGYWTRAGYNGR